MGAISLGRSFPALYTRPLTSLSDERLATLVHGGNDEAFEVLFQRYRAPLSRYCRSILRDPEDAHDAYQSTMLAALRALRDRRLSGRVRPWLYRIAHNESITVVRRRRGHEQLDEQTPSTRGELQQLEQWEILISDLRTLPERQRGALLMRELGGLEYHEIGVALSMSTIRARKVVFEARSALSDNAAGRDTSCAEVRLKISNCDGRALRGRRIRGHLDACGPCAAFALSVSDRRRALALIPVGPGLPIGGALGGGLGLAAGGVGGGGIAAGGLAIGTGSAGLAAKGIASAVCALCALAGAGVVLGSGQHQRTTSNVAPAIHVSRQPLGSSRAVAQRQANVTRHAAHVHSSVRSASTAGRRVATAPTVRIGSPQQRVAHAPAAKIAPATPGTATASGSRVPVSGTTSAPAGTAGSPVAASTTAPSTVYQQLIEQLIQNAIAGHTSLTPAQQSQLLALAQQWDGSGAAGASSYTYSSVESLISKMTNGWTPTARGSTSGPTTTTSGPTTTTSGPTTTTSGSTTTTSGSTTTAAGATTTSSGSTTTTSGSTTATSGSTTAYTGSSTSAGTSPTDIYRTSWR